ncbi:MAG: hypothetical protein QOE31_54 [Solirubrobacteraceae bacterium]|jgi:hypothetical protein|nr:hypothetical protein [Solirubrobacteraceae bacterium]
MNRFKNKMRIAAGVVALSLVTAGAYAYWTGGGTGGGSAAVGTAGTVTVTATVATGIAPGTAKAVTFTAANATASPIQVTTVHLDGITADAGHAACVTDDFSMADVGQAFQVPAGATTQALPNAGSLVYANTAADQDACKGATLTLALSSI